MFVWNNTFGVLFDLWTSVAKIISWSYDRRKLSHVHSCSLHRDLKQTPALFPDQAVMQLQNSVTVRGRQTTENSETLDFTNSAGFQEIAILAGKLKW